MQEYWSGLIFPSPRDTCVHEVAQLCLTLCNPMDCSPPGSSVHGILQARILEWVAIPSPGDLPSPGIKPGHPALQADSLPSEPPGSQSRPGSDLALTSDKLSPLQLQCLQDLMLLLGLRWGTPVSCWVWFPAPVNAQYTPAATIIRYAGQGKRTQKEVSTVDSAHLWWAALMIFAFLFSYPQWGTIAFIEI